MINNKIIPESKSECCGCGICENVCPKNAITMYTDNEGFRYPKIDENKCIKCGLCNKNCSFGNKDKTTKIKNKKCYIAKSIDEKIRLNSQSGGIFALCSDWIFSKEGVVYGCILDENFNVIHVKAENEVLRDEMCKSKYAQSNIENCINQIEEDLLKDKYVLFSGTGCQVDAVIKYLRFKKICLDKFYTIDIICHGVSSPMIFKDYITWLEKKYKSKVLKFNFRDKNVCGWDGHIETAIINNKKYKFTYYREIFHKDTCLRPACYNCKYSCVERNSDITIGDAWGIKQNLTDFNDNKGCSMIIVQNTKGEKLLKELHEVCELLEVDIQKFMQPNLCAPSKTKMNREAFWITYNKEGMDGIIKKYGTLTIKKKVKAKIKYLARKIIYGKKLYLP